jgi:hypothetical protein
MNVGQLEAEFRERADDLVEPYLWSPADFLRWLNQAQDEACIRQKLIFESVRPEICKIAVSEQGGSIYNISDRIAVIEYAYLVDASNCRHKLTLTDTDELDRVRPNWRECTDRPEFLIHRDNTVQFGGLIRERYTLKLEVYRLPTNCLKEERDTPEINQVHHIHLIDWVLHKAYSKPDSETLNPGKSQKAEADFTDYFGVRPDANMRKRENANTPHRNKAYW